MATITPNYNVAGTSQGSATTDSPTYVGLTLTGKGYAQDTAGGPNWTVGTNTKATYTAEAINSAAALNRDYLWQTAGVSRWAARCTSTAESGSDAGSNWNLIALTDAGAAIDIPISIARVTAGTMTFGGTTARTAAFTGKVAPPAGTTAIVPVQFTAGTNLTAAVAGGCEFDGVNYYQTIDTTSGRGCVPVEQYNHLTANGSTISTIANFFGATSNISLVANAYYEIDIELFFLNTTSGTVVWTLTNSAAPTSQNIYFEMSPVTGIVAPPGTATELVGMVINDATATLALSATGALTTAVNHYCKMRILLKNGSGTSLKIQATKSAGTITPLLGSNWKCRRMSPNNIGTFSA